jgi:hypothetical protein
MRRTTIHGPSTDTAGPVTYFIQAVHGGPIKIGRSTRAYLPKRLAALQTGNPDPLRITHVLDGDHEARLHREFRNERLSGEWFMPTVRLCSMAHAVPGGDADDAYGRGFHDGFAAGACQVYEHVRDTVADAVDDITSGMRRDIGCAFEDLDTRGTAIALDSTVGDIFGELAGKGAGPPRTP